MNGQPFGGPGRDSAAESGHGVIFPGIWQMIIRLQPLPDRGRQHPTDDLPVPGGAALRDARVVSAAAEEKLEGAVGRKIRSRRTGRDDTVGERR